MTTVKTIIIPKQVSRASTFECDQTVFLTEIDGQTCVGYVHNHPSSQPTPTSHDLHMR